MANILDIKKSPDEFIGKTFNNSTVVGWGRTNTTDSGQRYIGFGIYTTDIALKLKNGERVLATVYGPKF